MILNEDKQIKDTNFMLPLRILNHLKRLQTTSAYCISWHALCHGARIQTHTPLLLVLFFLISFYQKQAEQNVINR